MADGSGVKEEKFTDDDLVTAQRMLKVLDDQIMVLKRRVDRCKKDWTMLPTDRQAFFYSSNNNGIIQFHSDSEFVAEQIFVYGNPDGGRTFLSIEDLSAGRKLTTAQEPNFNDPSLSKFADPYDTFLTNKATEIWIPPSAWAPTIPYTDVSPLYTIGLQPIWNFDHIATFETDFVVARGGALRFRFRHAGDGSFYPFTTTYPDNRGAIPPLNYTVTLIGYKVY